MLALFSIMLCLAADIEVRRVGTAFLISGPVQAADAAFYVGEGDVPPVLGKFTTHGQFLQFEPRFEIPRTLAVRAVVNAKTFHFPATATQSKPTTRVSQIYPTASRLPANLLKFYIEFSAPMLPGEAWQNIQLLDANQMPVELAFLEIDQELWDRDNRRLTILFDPGRIKRGVTPRDEVGSSLQPGQTYTLKVSSKWRDETRTPLTSEFTKTFEVTQEDRTAIHPATWRLTTPKPNTLAPLTIEFNEPLDAPLALRLIQIPLSGTATLGPEERSLRFTPSQPWPSGPMSITIDTALEDLAGNKVGRPFDVDTFDPVTIRTKRGIVRLPFNIR